jgi:putative membrane protein
MADPSPPEPYDEAVDPRIYFAAERTHLAWVRTGLALMGFGFVVARFGLFLRELAAEGRPGRHPHAAGLSLYLGVGLVALGVGVTVAASVKHAKRIGRLRRGEPVTPRRLSLEMVVGLALALLGIAMGAYLLGFE